MQKTRKQRSMRSAKAGMNYAGLVARYLRFLWQKQPYWTIGVVCIYMLIMSSVIANNVFYILITSKLLDKSEWGSLLLVGKFVVDGLVMAATYWLDNALGHGVRMGVLEKLLGAEARSYHGDDPYAVARAADCGYRVTRENPLPGLMQFWSAFVSIGTQVYLLFAQGSQKVAVMALGVVVCFPFLLWWWFRNVSAWGNKKHRAEDDLSAMHRKIVRYGIAGRLFGPTQKSLRKQAIEKSKLYKKYNILFQTTSQVPSLLGLVLVVVLFTIGLHHSVLLVLAALAQVGLALSSIASLQDKAGKVHAIVVRLQKEILELPQQGQKAMLSEGAFVEAIELQCAGYRPPVPDNPAAVAGISLRVEKGGCVVFLGPGGAGKATICRLLTGLVQATEGEVLCQVGNRDGSSSIISLASLDVRPTVAVVAARPEHYAGQTSIGSLLMHELLEVEWMPGRSLGKEVIDDLKQLFQIWGQGTTLWQDFKERAVAEALGDSSKVVELMLEFLLQDWGIWERLAEGLATPMNRVNIAVKHLLAVMVACLQSIAADKQVVWMDEPELYLDEPLASQLVEQLWHFRERMPEKMLLLSTTSQKLACLLGNSQVGGKVVLVQDGGVLAYEPYEVLSAGYPVYQDWQKKSLEELVKRRGLTYP